MNFQTAWKARLESAYFNKVHYSVTRGTLGQKTKKKKEKKKNCAFTNYVDQDL